LLGRKDKDELSIGNTKRTAEYTYKRPFDDSTKTSFEVEHMKTLSNENIYYNYDDLGNITEMDTPEGTYEYKYDFMGRLIEEYNPVLNQTIKIEYNKQNITYKRYYTGKTENMVKQLEYLTNAEDQLMYVGTIEGGNETPLDISYDPKYVGNPSEIGSKELVWEGRRLKEILDGEDTFSYSYNEQGLRTKKNINGVETKYHLKETNIIAEVKNGQTLYFIHNEQNQLVGFEHQQIKYFYVRDLLGVIRNIIDINFNIVVTYKYDAWGNHKVYDSSNAENTSSSFVGNINPFRYKGYYYDVETGWYYLQSRYYCPLLSRFINMDQAQNLEPGSVDGINLLSYCNNNPVMGIDSSGTWNWNKIKKVAKIVGMVVAAVAVVALVTAVTLTAGAAAYVILGAAAQTSIATVMIGAMAGGAIAGTVNMLGQASKIGDDPSKFDFGSLIIDTFTGSAFGAISAFTGPGASFRTKVAVGFSKVALTALSTGLHGINEGKSSSEVWKEIGIRSARSAALQVIFIGGGQLFGKSGNSGFISEVMKKTNLISSAIVFGRGIYNHFFERGE